MYSKEDLAKTIEVLIERLKPFLSDAEFDTLCDQYPAVHEVNAFGPNGPVGLGLGNYGGHAVG